MSFRAHRFSMWTAFQLSSTLPLDKQDRAELVREALREVSGGDNATSEDLEVVVRGWYDLSGMRSDADLMVWLHGPSLACVQRAFERLRASNFGRCIEPVWSNVAIAGTNQVGSEHTPAFLADRGASKFVTVYPVIRATDWYQQPESRQDDAIDEWARCADNRDASHASILSAVGLGDYDWIVAIEADDVIDMVNHVHGVQKSQASAQLKVETPVFTGSLINLALWADRQPQSDFDLE